MSKHVIGAALALGLLLGSASFAHGQKATERFIPIGSSPGVSGVQTAIGEVVSVDTSGRRIGLVGPAGPSSVSIPEGTPIWIDRHTEGLPTLTGSFADLRAGRSVEVKYADPATRQRAEWLKLEAEPGDATPAPPAAP